MSDQNDPDRFSGEFPLPEKPPVKLRPRRWPWIVAGIVVVALVVGLCLYWFLPGDAGELLSVTAWANDGAGRIGATLRLRPGSVPDGGFAFVAFELKGPTERSIASSGAMLESGGGRRLLNVDLGSRADLVDGQYVLDVEQHLVSEAGKTVWWERKAATITVQGAIPRAGALSPYMSAPRSLESDLLLGAASLFHRTPPAAAGVRLAIDPDLRGEPFRLNDRFTVQVAVERPGFLYTFVRDSAGRVTRVSPDPAAAVKAGDIRRLAFAVTGSGGGRESVLAVITERPPQRKEELRAPAALSVINASTAGNPVSVFTPD